MNIRVATKKDLEKILSFQDLLVDQDRVSDDTIPRSGSVAYYDIQKLLIADDVKFLVIEVTGAVVGCGFGQIKKDKEWSVKKKIGYIGLVFIEEKYRHKGFGKLLFDKLCTWFKENKIVDIRLDTYAENIQAIEAYRTYGFQEFIVVMRKKLS